MLFVLLLLLLYAIFALINAVLCIFFILYFKQTPLEGNLKMYSTVSRLVDCLTFV